MRYRTLIWPALLILAGVVALLINTGAIPADRWIVLFNLWPLILIVLGVELIIRRGMQGVAADAAAAAVVIVAVVAAAVYVAVTPGPAVTNKLDLSEPAGDLHQASLQLNFGSSTIRISDGSDLGSRLFQAHIESPNPGLDWKFDQATGALTISQHTNFPFGLQNGHVAATIELSSEVTWTIHENTGASTDAINVSHAKVGAITINTGASREDLTLSAPSGVVPVQVNGGALTVHIHRPAGTEASVDVSGGAISLAADGNTNHAVGALHFQSSGFGGASDAYRIKVNGGACTVTLDTSSG
ncbi:MAG TPA: DUF5668 domain-containing protein [Candidatus Dormibacteraeota bacterium]|nr:DUF5668 domain-containing protein [Candidatus Dormibacteraeota bacterium]